MYLLLALLGMSAMGGMIMSGGADESDDDTVSEPDAAEDELETTTDFMTGTDDDGASDDSGEDTSDSTGSDAGSVFDPVVRPIDQLIPEPGMVQQESGYGEVLAALDIEESDLDGDLYRGSDGNDTIIGGPDTDILFGNEGSDLLQGRGGMDLLIDDEGHDTLSGQGGSDLLIGSGLFDVDALQTLESDPAESVSELVDRVVDAVDLGIVNADGVGGSMYDSDGHGDLLSGGDGDDVLFGGSDDTMVGGAGMDLFIGGEYVAPGQPLTITDYDPDEDAIIYATADGTADNLSFEPLNPDDPNSDMHVLDGGVHVLTVRGAGQSFGANDIFTLQDVLAGST